MTRTPSGLARQVMGESSIQSSLFAAIQANSPERVEQAIRDGAQVNTPDAGPLVMVAYRNNASMCALLLKHGAVPNGTVMDTAIRSGATRVVKLLLDAGVDPDERGGSFLVQAIGHYNLEIANLLLDAGADPSLRSGQALNVLMLMPERRGSGDLAVRLLKGGADPVQLDAAFIKAIAPRQRAAAAQLMRYLIPETD